MRLVIARPWRRGCRLLVIALVSFCSSLATAAPLPSFSLENSKGEKISSDAYRGKVVMLNFWASWCAPCRKEMPLLNAIYQELHGQGFELFAINTESSTGDAEALLAEMGLDFPILWDREGTVVQMLGVNAMPTTLVIDTEGEIQFVNRGYRPGDEKKYREQVIGLLPAPGE